MRSLPPPFSVVLPTTEETPLVVEVPHAGLHVDGPALATLVAPARAIGRDADLYVDELYEAVPTTGATLLCAHVSRYVASLYRRDTDLDADAVEGAPRAARATRGIVWRLTSDAQKVLEGPLPRRELERRLDLVYRPYHQTLAALLERKRAKFGFALLLAAHSMPSVGRAGHGDPSAVRADVVPGTRGRTSASGTIISAVDQHARAAGLSVTHDDPYQGGFTTQHYGRPDLAVHVVQVELARRLYMNESTLQKNGNFEHQKAWCTALAARLGASRP